MTDRDAPRHAHAGTDCYDPACKSQWDPPPEDVAGLLEEAARDLDWLNSFRTVERASQEELVRRRDGVARLRAAAARLRTQPPLPQAIAPSVGSRSDVTSATRSQTTLPSLGNSVPPVLDADSQGDDPGGGTLPPSVEQLIRTVKFLQQVYHEVVHNSPMERIELSTCKAKACSVARAAISAVRSARSEPVAWFGHRIGDTLHDDLNYATCAHWGTKEEPTWCSTSQAHSPAFAAPPREDDSRRILDSILNCPAHGAVAGACATSSAPTETHTSREDVADTLQAMATARRLQIAALPPGEAYENTQDRLTREANGLEYAARAWRQRGGADE